MAEEVEQENSPVDRSAIFTSILHRQALRREAHLPLLDVRAEYGRAVGFALWKAHVERHYERIRAEVLSSRRAKHGEGWGLRVGGRWVVEYETTRALRLLLRRDR